MTAETHIKLKNVANEFIDYFGDFINIENVILNLETPWELGYSRELVKNDFWWPVIEGVGGDNWAFRKDHKKFLKYAYGIRLRRLAYKILPLNFGTSNIFVDWRRGWPSTTYDYGIFSDVYTILEQLYFIQLNRKLGCDDLLDLYFGGLDERLVFFLDDFDQINDEEIPTPTKEFFQAIKYVKYQNNTIKMMLIKLEELIYLSLKNTFGNCQPYHKLEKNVIKTLVHSSAIKNNRNEIKVEDIITAYNTYFKLLQTDVTQYKLRKDVFNNTNYNSLKARFVYFSLKIGISHG